MDKKMEMQSSGQPENKMGVMPVGKLLANMSIPMMISMLVQALYNIVDSIFVAQLSENALSAVSLAFPLQTLMIAVGAGTGVGVNALLSKSLGEKNYEKVNAVAMNGMFLFALSWLLFLVIGLTCVRPFYASQIKGADPEIMEMGISYLTIALTCSFGIFVQFINERLLASTGRTFYSMLSQLTGAITNIVLDPVLIFGLFGMPAMGVAGAALATVIGQIFGGSVALYFSLTKNPEVSLSLRGFRPDKQIIGSIYRVGLPSIIMQSIGSVMTYGMNLILIGFTSTATVVFGAYFKLQSFFFMPLFGMNNGLIPIIAYNYGAGNKRRMIKAIKLSMVVAAGLMALGLAAFNLIPAQLLGLFDASPELLAIGVPALRVISLHFLMAWFCIIAGSCFQALGNGVYSLIVSVMRQLVVLLPAAWLLARFGGLSAVWWAFPIAEISSALTSITLLIRIYKKVIRPLPDGR